MRAAKLQREKIKRILLYFQELDRLKIDHKAQVEFMSYVFHVQEERLWRIQRENSLDKLSGVELDHFDVDVVMIDGFVRKLTTIARKERNNQMKLAI